MSWARSLTLLLSLGCSTGLAAVPGMRQVSLPKHQLDRIWCWHFLSPSSALSALPSPKDKTGTSMHLSPHPNHALSLHKHFSFFCSCPPGPTLIPVSPFANPSPVTFYTPRCSAYHETQFRHHQGLFQASPSTSTNHPYHITSVSSSDCPTSCTV